ncbi:YncE family protein [Sphingomonas panacisoli]|uniref:YncE family protein n=1 Tax=Sphingomonas panacisoli TaxID=1813879 RepID=A0A5B8LHV1_9SPHN|nr:YncE family protein [Sphingomonas panacisoli]QDZ07887.1 YncE family protein [Sphingomonas panacisoli]
MTVRRVWLLLGAIAMPAQADIAVSASDGKQVLADGRQVVPSPLGGDNVSVIDFGNGKLRVVATIAAPASLIGPPRSVAITPDGAYAIVTCARKVRADGTDIEPDDRVSVIDLRSMTLVSSIRAGAGASGVAIDPAGRRVLIANRAAGTLSLLAFEKGRLSPVATIAVGPATSSPAQPLFYDNGRKALVTRDGDHRISIVTVTESGLSLDETSLAGGLRPYAIDAAGPRYAVVGNIGGGGRNVDTISLIDLAGETSAVVDTVAVGLTPEGVKMSPDGRFVAVIVHNGSNLPRGARLWSDHGLLQIWRIAGDRLVKVTEARMGGWGQGAVWSKDGRQILAQAALDHRIQSFDFDGARLRRGPELTLSAAPAAIAGRP